MKYTVKLDGTAEKFAEILEIIRFLQGAEGCPWDQKQTLLSVRSQLVEEVYELIEAINLDKDDDIIEESGDVLLTTIFLFVLAERHKSINIDDILQCVIDKMLRRHPHVFGDIKINTCEEAYVHWQKIKKEEKGKEHRKSVLDGIPMDLPALALAQKMMKKGALKCSDDESTFADDDELGRALIDIVAKARRSSLDAENSLRKVLSKCEKEFRAQE
jgi:tetrapyrrole methylase family protein / MazG family protein